MSSLKTAKFRCAKMPFLWKGKGFFPQASIEKQLEEWNSKHAEAEIISHSEWSKKGVVMCQDDMGALTSVPCDYDILSVMYHTPAGVA